MQLFLVRYPNTTLKDSCNTLIDKMRTKLEVKAYHAAEQYYKMRTTKRRAWPSTNFNREWPNSRFREDAMFFILQEPLLPGRSTAWNPRSGAIEGCYASIS